MRTTTARSAPVTLGVHMVIVILALIGTPAS